MAAAVSLPPNRRNPIGTIIQTNNDEARSVLKGARAAVLLFSHYPYDPRPRRAAEGMIEAGMEVDLLCLAQPGEPTTEVVNQVKVTRTRITRRRGGKIGYLTRYGLFF